MPKKKTPKKKSFFSKYFNSRGNIAFTVLLLVIIVGSFLMVSGAFPKGQITPPDPNAPVYDLDPNDPQGGDKNSLQLKTINFQKCSESAAVIMLLDTTDSMDQTTPSGEKKIDKLKNSTKVFLENFSDDSVIGIQEFNTKRRREVVPVTLFKNVKENINSQIESLQTDGSTPTAAGLRFSLEIIRTGKVQFPDRNFVFIFVSDGQPTDGYSITSKPDPAEEIKGLGVTIYSIGILSSSQMRQGTMKRLLEHIASDPGKAYIAPEGDELTEIYTEIGSKLCGSRPSA
jgi:Mg-chelatase subunit ChlD